MQKKTPRNRSAAQGLKLRKPRSSRKSRKQAGGCIVARRRRCAMATCPRPRVAEERSRSSRSIQGTLGLLSRSSKPRRRACGRFAISGSSANCVPTTPVRQCYMAVGAELGRSLEALAEFQVGAGASSRLPAGQAHGVARAAERTCPATEDEMAGHAAGPNRHPAARAYCRGARTGREARTAAHVPVTLLRRLRSKPAPQPGRSRLLFCARSHDAKP